MAESHSSILNRFRKKIKDGFYGASFMERVLTERAIREQTE
jgi:predicted TIM-barrel enzyme